MIDHLKAEIARLNDELTYVSEAHQSLTADNLRMKAALEIAEKAFRQTGNAQLVGEMSYGRTGERPAPKGFKLPSSRKVA